MPNFTVAYYKEENVRKKNFNKDGKHGDWNDNINSCSAVVLSE